MIDILILILLALAVEACTEIIVNAKITDGIRAYIFVKATNLDSKQSDYSFWPFVNNLVTCGYCASVWVSVLFAFFAPRLWDLWFIVNLFIMVLVLHRLSNVIHMIIMLLYKGRVLTMDVEIGRKPRE